MRKFIYINLFLLFNSFGLIAQINPLSKGEVRGSVKGKENNTPISGIVVSSDSGSYVVTDAFGEFKILVAIGEELVFKGDEIETVFYTVKSFENIDVLVEGYSLQETNKNNERSKYVSRKTSHKVLLDSAINYKDSDIAKSVEFITQSIAILGKRGNKKELAESFTVLGEVYVYHRQYDLAISSYKDALAAYPNNKTTLLLGRVLVLHGNHNEALELLKPLLEVKNLVPYQKIELLEAIGDSYNGLGNGNEAVSYYEAGLVIAKKNQVAPKLADLNSKIGDAYNSEDKRIEAEGFYSNSLELSKSQAPQRAIQEKEKVADFYNKNNKYEKEILLRKESLGDINALSSKVKAGDTNTKDSISSQRINYKIANAYIAQEKLEEAIPYLQKSIVEANVDDDLVVQKDATRKLSEVYKSTGDYSKALETYQAYVKVVDTLYIRKEQEISRAARLNRDLASKQNRISGLEQERELSQSKYDLAYTEQQLSTLNNKRQKWVIYSLIIGLILTGLAAFFFYRSNQQQKVTNNLLALKSLRTQMNPHFIFNALNSVNNYISKNDERSANRYLSDFSTLMRAVLENSDEDFIPLSKELELLELYVKLEHSRFEDKFHYEVKVDETIDVASFQIPPMLLQPYIENAIWHGLRYKEDKGFLNINISAISLEAIKIVISDNGIGRKKSAELKTQNQKKQKSKGMGNIKKRIAILNEMHKDKVDVHISDLESTGQGTKVEFTLKKE